MRKQVTCVLLAVGMIACQGEGENELADTNAPGGTDDLGGEGAGGGGGGSQFLKGVRVMPGTDGLMLLGDDLWIALTLNDAVLVVSARTGALKRVVASELDPDATELLSPDDLWRDPITGDVYVAQVGDGTGGHVDKIAPDGTRTRVLTHFADNNAFPNGITGIHRPGEPVHVYIAPVNFFGGKTGIYEIDLTGANNPPTLIYGAQNNVDVYGTGLPGGGNGMEFDSAGNELYTPVTFGGAVLAIDVANHTARTVWNGNGGTSRGVYVRFSADRQSLLFTEHSTGKLLRLNPAGPADQVPQLVAQLDIGIDGLAIAPDGKIYVSNFITGGVAVVRPDGSVQQLYTRSMNVPNGIDDLPDGRLVVGDIPSLAIVPANGGSSLPVRPKFFIDGDITQGVGSLNACDTYVTTYFRRNIQHYNTCTMVPNVSTNIVPLLSMGLPNDIAFDGSIMYVSDAAGLVWKLTVNGATPTTAAPIATGLQKPNGIAFSAGKVYVSEFNGNQVRVIETATNTTVRTITGLSGPEGLAVDSSGAVYVVESNLGKLTKISTSGSRRTVASGLGTQIRGLAQPLVNLYSDVMLRGQDAIVTEPLTGSIRKIRL